MSERPSCTYDQFDMQTFEPLNEETRVRLAEVNFQESTFAGKSVLDIGANSGLLSIQACRNGADRVTSIDVVPVFIECLEEILKHHDLPMTIRRQAVAELDPATDVHDVVLFFEVIHWTTAQGLPIPDAIEKVANVTGETLIIEFPWDIREPSIQGQTSLTIEEYDSSIIIEELSARFHDISFERFMSYFKGQALSRRALMTATSPKLSPAFFDVPGFRPAVENPIGQGQNSSAYVRANETDYFVKGLPAWSPLAVMPIEVVDEFLASLGDGPVLHPLQLNERRVSQSGPRRVLAYPWLGNADGSISTKERPSVDEALDLGRRTVVQLGQMDPNTVQSLADNGLRAIPQGEKLASRIEATGPSAGLSTEQVAQLAALARATGEIAQTHLVHGDLHRSNMLPGPNGEFVVSDLDTLQLGGPFTDMFWQAGFQNLSAVETQQHLDALQALRPVNRPEPHDALGAMGLLLGWLDVAARHNARQDHLDRVRQGLQTLLPFAGLA